MDELTKLGFRYVLDGPEVKATINTYPTVLALVDDTCGCGSRAAHESTFMGVMATEKVVHNLMLLVPGQHDEAIAQLWELAKPYPPSQPAIMLFKDGEIVFFLERHQIKGQPIEEVANAIKEVIEQHGHTMEVDALPIVK